MVVGWLTVPQQAIAGMQHNRQQTGPSFAVSCVTETDR